MKKISHTLFYFILMTFAAISWSVLNFKEPNWNFVGPMIGAIVLVLGLWFRRLPKIFWISAVLSGLTLCALMVSVGPQWGLLFILAEALFLLMCDELSDLERRLAYFVALAFVGLIAFDLGDFVGPIAFVLFVGGRSLFWPQAKGDDKQKSEFLLFWFVTLSTSVFLISKNIPSFYGSQIILGALVLICVLFGRPVGALTAAVVTVAQIEPNLFFVLPLVLVLISAGFWGYRVALVFVVLSTVPLVMKNPSIENIIGLSLSGFSLGLLWWFLRTGFPRWIDFGAAIIVGGVAVFLNQNWFFELSLVSSPTDVSALAAWTVGFILGGLLRKRFKPVVLPAIKVKRPNIRIVFPSFKVSVPYWPGVFSRYYFFVVLLLVVSAAILWGVQPLYDSL